MLRRAFASPHLCLMAAAAASLHLAGSAAATGVAAPFGAGAAGVGKTHCGACGYACDASCDCGRCNTKPGCMTSGQCLGSW